MTNGNPTHGETCIVLERGYFDWNYSYTTWRPEGWWDRTRQWRIGFMVAAFSDGASSDGSILICWGKFARMVCFSSEMICFCLEMICFYSVMICFCSKLINSCSEAYVRGISTAHIMLHHRRFRRNRWKKSKWLYCEAHMWRILMWGPDDDGWCMTMDDDGWWLMMYDDVWCMMMLM